LRPVLGRAPGEIVPNDLGFFTPPNAIPGARCFEIAMYHLASEEEWRVAGQAAQRLEAGSVVK
jgi:hypothetical protein